MKTADLSPHQREVSSLVREINHLNRVIEAYQKDARAQSEQDARMRASVHMLGNALLDATTALHLIWRNEYADRGVAVALAAHDAARAALSKVGA